MVIRRPDGDVVRRRCRFFGGRRRTNDAVATARERVKKNRSRTTSLATATTFAAAAVAVLLSCYPSASMLLRTPNLSSSAPGRRLGSNEWASAASEAAVPVSSAFSPSLNTRTLTQQHSSAPRRSSCSRRRWHQSPGRPFTALTVLSSSAAAATAGGTLKVVDVRERAPRNIFGMKQWAETVCGIRTCEGFRLDSDPADEQDWSVSTSKPLSPDDMVLYVPSEVILSSTQIETQYGPYLQEAERRLAEQADLAHQIPLFRLYAKLLVEYELGEQSPYFPWLDSLPRRFNNGVAMTSACFDCLPPYAAWLARKERDDSDQFRIAIQYASNAGLISEATVSNEQLTKWAYCVAATRSLDLGGGERVIVPVADMFNHYGGERTEVRIGFDGGGNFVAHAARDVPAGSPLRISYGDPTNPSPLFATYGFLDKSSPGTFCKLMHLQQEMADLQLDFSNLLFYKDTGDVSSEVWDLLLYSFLKYDEEQDPSMLQGFYEAYMSGDVETKNQYHEHFFQYTLEALREHVDGMLDQLEYLSARADSKDIATHPRISLILQHNEFVKSTFLKVKANLDAM